MRQLSRKQQKREQEWIKRQSEEARNNASAPLTDCSTASFFDLKARADLGDELAKLEIESRRTK